MCSVNEPLARCAVVIASPTVWLTWPKSADRNAVFHTGHMLYPPAGAGRGSPPLGIVVVLEGVGAARNSWVEART